MHPYVDDKVDVSRSHVNPQMLEKIRIPGWEGNI